MNRQQNRPRNRDDFDKFNRNRPRNNDDRRRNDGNRGWRRNDQDGRMAQNRGLGRGGGVSGGAEGVGVGGGYGQMNIGGYSQNVPLYTQQTQMPNYGGFASNNPPFQQNRFGISQQQRLSPWANNMMPGMASSGEEAKLAMNILNAVLSSGAPGGSGRGISPPPNKMRRMDQREGGYDDRRRRPRSPPGRSSHPNRQQSSQRFGSDRRGRDGHSSNQRNDDHRFRNSVNKNPGIARSSRQSSSRSSEVVQRKRQSFEERERETKEYSDLPAKALKCRMCDKSEFHNVAAYLAHVHSKGHAKVAKAYHEKITALTTLLKQNAKLALHKELIRAKASGKKANEKECRVCEAPMVFGNLKHKNILACKILHKFTNQTLCCGKDHKYRNMVEEHCLTLAHLKAKYESECQSEEKETKQEESAEDEIEKLSRQKRDEARRKRKFGDDETDEEEEEEDDDEENENEENKGKDGELNSGNEKREEDNVADEDQEKQMDKVEKMETNEEDAKVADDDKDKRDSSSAVDEEVETRQDEKKEDRKEEESSNNQVDIKDQKQQQNDRESIDKREDDGDDRRGKMFRSRNNRKDIDQAKIIQQMSLQELLDFHKKFLVDDPEKLGPYDPANPIGLNYIETHVAFHCMACIEYYPAAIDELMSHCCSKDHYKMFRSKYMKLQGVRDSPTSLSRLKAAREREIKRESERSQERDTKDKDQQGEDKNKDKEEGDHKEVVAGDDALYDPYEGESGDLTTLLQDKKSDEDPESQVPEGFEIKDEVHGSEPENYEDNILDYDEDVGEDAKDDDDDNEHQQKDKRYEADEYDEKEDYKDDENTEFQENDEYQGDENEAHQDNEKANYEEDENSDERVEHEYQEDDDDDDDEDDDEEEAPAPAVPARRGRSKRAF